MSDIIKASIHIDLDHDALHLYPQHTQSPHPKLCDVNVLPGAKLWKDLIDTGMGVYEIMLHCSVDDDDTLQYTHAELVPIEGLLKVVGNIFNEDTDSLSPLVYYTSEQGEVRVKCCGFDLSITQRDDERWKEVRHVTDDFTLYDDNILVLSNSTNKISNVACACALYSFGGYLFTCSTNGTITMRHLDRPFCVISRLKTGLGCETVFAEALFSDTLSRYTLVVTKSGRPYVCGFGDSCVHPVPIEGRVVEVTITPNLVFKMIVLDEHGYYHTVRVTDYTDPATMEVEYTDGPMSESNGIRVVYPQTKRIKSAVS